MPRAAFAALFASLATAAAGVPLWSWWTQTAAPWTAHLPESLAVPALLVGFRLALGPVSRAFSALALLSARPDRAADS